VSRRFTEAEIAEVWERRGAGEALADPKAGRVAGAAVLTL
jgi:hypothetical protein